MGFFTSLFKKNVWDKETPLRRLIAKLEYEEKKKKNPDIRVVFIIAIMNPICKLMGKEDCELLNTLFVSEDGLLRLRNDYVLIELCFYFHAKYINRLIELEELDDSFELALTRQLASIIAFVDSENSIEYDGKKVSEIYRNRARCYMFDKTKNDSKESFSKLVSFINFVAYNNRMAVNINETLEGVTLENYINNVAVETVLNTWLASYPEAIIEGILSYLSLLKRKQAIHWEI